MASTLAKLLDRIDPDRTLDEVARRVDDAVNTFPPPASRLTDWDQFRRCLAAFYRHAEAAVVRLRDPVDADVDFYWGRCVQPLHREYGANGEKAAFEMARTGTDGGLYRVLKDVARWLSEHYAQTEVSARINHFWNRLSTDEKLAATDEYLERFSHLLPSELTEGSAARIRADFPKVLEQHPMLILRLRQIGRSR